MKYIYILILSFFVSTILKGQNKSLNQKKYVIVKSSFDFLKQLDKYKTSSFTKFLFNKAGFDTYLDNEELPEDLYYNKCNALFVDVKDKSNLFFTKNFVELTDCKGNLFYTSEKGSSKLKDYERAYRESIRMAFSTIEKLDSIYDAFLLEVIQLKKEQKKQKESPLVRFVTSESDKPEKSEVISKSIVPSKLDTFDKSDVVVIPLLYAQKIETGYQLVDSKPSVVFVILKTNDKGKFIIKDKNGTLVNKGDYWVAEYYKGDILIAEFYQIKF
ncbi:MAG: Uncharacterised protein [Flavobacterium sp. SCGC AAA160-P02]|nr:MAG: Uncharacterised protein [Flavobacterium sp. SCGC AAA160-P02]